MHQRCRINLIRTCEKFGRFFLTASSWVQAVAVARDDCLCTIWRSTAPMHQPCKKSRQLSQEKPNKANKKSCQLSQERPSKANSSCIRWVALQCHQNESPEKSNILEVSFLKPFVGYYCRHLHWMVRAKAKIAVLCILKQFLKRKQDLTLCRTKNDGFLS